MKFLSPTLPFQPQHDATDCGPAVLRMVAGYHGAAPSMQALREMTGAGREGASIEDLAEAARKLGFEALTVWMGMDTDPGLEEAPLPCILHWEQRHFVVLYRLSRRYAWIADPARGKLRISRAQLKASWLGDGDRAAALLLIPKEDRGPVLDDAPSMAAFVWRHLRFYRKMLYLLMAGVLLGSLVAMAAPFLAQAVVDAGMPNRDLSFIALLLVGQLLIGLGQLGLQWWQAWLITQLGGRFQLNLLSAFLRRLTMLPQRFFDRRQVGDLLQRVDDHQRVEQWVAGDLVRIVYFSLFGLVFGLVLLLYSPLLFGVFLLGSAFYLAWALAFLRARRAIDHQRFEQLSAHQETLLETIQGMPDVKVQGSRERHFGKWGQVQRQLFQTNLRALWVRQMQDGGAGLINQVKDLLLVFLAARGVVAGEMTLGMFVAVQFIIGQLNVPISQLAQFIRSFQDARISLERIRVVQEEPTEVEEETSPPPIPFSGGISFENVSFRYHSAGKPVLDGIGLHFPEGKKIAIVGPSGSGKTTLLRLLLGLYLPESGTIRIGERVLDKNTLTAWRASCGAALQDGFLFSDSIAQNIAEADEKPDMERVEAAAKNAAIHEFILSLPHGYQTFIGPKGVQLSQGQRQRVLLARAWYRNPRFWVLDEATSALDAPTEDAVWEALSSQSFPATIVFSSHRLQTIQHADFILVIEDGRIAQSGPFHEISTRPGPFTHLFPPTT